MPALGLLHKYANQDGNIERYYKSHHPLHNKQFRVGTRKPILIIGKRLRGLARLVLRRTGGDKCVIYFGIIEATAELLAAVK